MNRDHFGFTPKELRKLRRLKDPHGIQTFVDAMPYHLADTAWSPRKVLAETRRIAWRAQSSRPLRCAPTGIRR